MIINAIYPTYQGEVNLRGIGAPVIFVRTGGCHLRCYKETLGTLCDTPEALEKKSGEQMTEEQVVSQVMSIRGNSGINLVCLSGGDPLWRKTSSVVELLRLLMEEGFDISIETSGTLSIREIREQTTALEKVYHRTVSFVLDYKLASAGVSRPFIFQDIDCLRHNDWIKFVAYDVKDLQEVEKVFLSHFTDCPAGLSVGVYWGGKLRNGELVKWLMSLGLIGRFHVNMQAHKLLTHYDLTLDMVPDTQIPRKI